MTSHSKFVRIRPDQHEKLVKVAAQSRRSIAMTLELLLDEVLEKHDKI